MPNTLIGITLDCNDMVTVAAFWRDALGYLEQGPPSTGAVFHGLMAPKDQGGLHHLTLQRVPELKGAKNRMHLDLFVDDLDAEVARLTALGGSIVQEVPAEPGGFRVTIMGDPEGHEFCVVQRP